MLLYDIANLHVLCLVTMVTGIAVNLVTSLRVFRNVHVVASKIATRLFKTLLLRITKVDVTILVQVK